ncbi:CDC91 cell division cycle 91 1, partial [Fasciola hepatica]
SYSVNPYSIVSFAAQSTSIVWNIVGVWSLIACFSGHLIMASCLCAVGCYLRFYPGYMLLPILITPFALPAATGLPSRLLRATASLLGFALTLAGLFWASYILENGQWLFLNSVYLYQFTFADCTAQLGIYWYMFVEMFEHFQDLFVWVFQLLLPVLVVALSLRFYYDPLYLSYLVAFLINVLQPYHSVGEFGYLIALLPLWSHLVKTARMRLITPCVLLSALVLTPLFRYMWLQPGTANANFYFSACMVYAVGQNLLFADLLNAYSKREYILRVGPSFKLKSGQELVLSHA